MAFPDDVFPADDHCEVCGAKLGHEVVIQEFADGTFARLCSECYAGVAFDPEGDIARGPFMAEGAGAGTRLADEEAAADLDPLEMTKELLSPVSDLLSLQGEMQTALERLAGSLERFASGVVIDSLDRTTMLENRIKSLEAELERTRSSLRETESLMIVAGGTDPGAGAAGEIEAPATPPSSGPEEATAAEGPPPVFAPATNPYPEDEALPRPADTEIDADLTQELDTAGYWTTVGTPAPLASGGETVASAPFSPGVFTLEEVQWTQRYLNESPFTTRMRDVRRSLGKPQANLCKVAGAEPRVLVTIFWDIVWYQYLVELRKEGFTGERVSLFREGMELGELNECFKDKNASVDDEGRVDASELEVRLLSDPTVLITEMPAAQEQALEDATEEIWDQHAAPEFKWDD